MAVVIVRLKGNRQQGGCNCNGQQQATATTTGDKKAAKAAPQRVEQRAAAMPQTTTAATSEPAKQEAGGQVSYMTAFTLIGIIGGIYLISQYK